MKTRRDFMPDMSPIQETLEEVKATLRQHFEIKDWEGVDFDICHCCGPLCTGRNAVAADYWAEPFW